jgi:hypothetical protein
MLRRLITPPILRPVTREAASRWPLYAGLGAASLLMLMLYLNTLSLPFFQDDVIHLRWLSYHRLLDPWLTAENLPNYRPLGEFLLKLWSVILGYNAAAFLRLQNILMGIVNTWLVAALVLQLDPVCGLPLCLSGRHLDQCLFLSAGCAAHALLRAQLLSRADDGKKSLVVGDLAVMFSRSS